jgi:hypothetical protein
MQIKKYPTSELNITGLARDHSSTVTVIKFKSIRSHLQKIWEEIENITKFWQENVKGKIESSGMLRRVAPVRTDVSKELSASFIRVTRIGELGTTLAVTRNRKYLVFLCSVCRLLVTTSVVPSSRFLSPW